jgi:uridine kinase
MAILKNHIHVNLHDLEKNLTGFRIEDYIRKCEESFDLQAYQVMETVKKNREIRAVFISGPTASGKTTFTHKLADYFHQALIQTATVSLDDYYYTKEFRTDPYGRPDFESLDTLDILLMVTQIGQILTGEIVKVPHFDFILKDRVPKKAREVFLPQGGVLLVEGLHGLSEKVSGALPGSHWLGVFIMPYATLSEDRKLLDRRDIRILRRISRDALHRGACALSTIDYWPMLDYAEEIHFREYLRVADIYVNSFMPYEFYCVAPLAHQLIAKSILDHEKGVQIDSNLTIHRRLAQEKEALREAKRLLSATKKIPSIRLSLVPETSILNEFIK